MGKNRNFFARWTPAIYWSLVSKPVSQDIQSICYCLHPGIFRLDTRDLLVAVVPISISSKYLYLYLALKVLTIPHPSFNQRLINFVDAFVHGCNHSCVSSAPIFFNMRIHVFVPLRNLKWKMWNRVGQIQKHGLKVRKAIKFAKLLNR